jgi:two-component system, NarL family, sensor histidine kinase UhpB
MPLFWRVFITNAFVLTAAAAALALSPATVSFPVARAEAAVLVVGLVAMLGLNLALLRRAFAPLDRLKRFMRNVDPLAPGGRVPVANADTELAQLTEAFNEMIERLETERRESARRTLAAQESERARIARDLHDEVGQTFTAAMLQLQQLADKPPDDARDAAELARQEVRSGLEELRRVAQRLRPEALDDLGLVSALTALTVDLGRRTGLRIVRRIEAELPTLSAEEEVVVYRIAQEALTNVVRHAGATRASLTLRADADGLRLTVTDDGDGFEGRLVTSGSGIRGMRERAVLIGALLDVRPANGVGTAVHLTVPHRGGVR